MDKEMELAMMDKLEALAREYMRGDMPAVEFLDAAINVLEGWDVDDMSIRQFAERIAGGANGNP